MSDNGNKVALVVGAGDGTGGAVACRFAQEGFTVCATRRSAEAVEALCGEITAAGGTAYPFAVDARDETEVTALMDRIEAEVGPIEVCVFNVGGNVRFPITEMTAETFERTWRTTCFAAFLVGREAAARMVPRGHGTIIFTGATASVRGCSGFAAFAAAKHGKRALAQSMARELGPKGIHVAHVVIDGVIDTQAVKNRMPDLYEDRRSKEALLRPDAIAEVYWHIHTQPRSAWAWEMDLRPWAEPW